MLHRTAFEKIGDSINVILLLVIALFMLFLFVYVFSVSSKKWIPDAYEYIFASKNFILSLLVSVYPAFVGTLANLFFTSTMAAILVATLPILVLYPFLQKHFTKGVMLGLVKEYSS